jgi:CRISPR system Cascade subunit CasC
MFGQGLPSYVLAVKREGQPLSLANAFEKPVTAKQGSGFVEPSIKALKEEWTALKAAFGIDGGIECEIEKGKNETASLADVLAKLLANIG